MNKLKLAEQIIQSYGQKPGQEWTNTIEGIAQLISDHHSIETPQGKKIAVFVATDWFLVDAPNSTCGDLLQFANTWAGDDLNDRA